MSPLPSLVLAATLRLLADDPSQPSLGECGGVMTGYDGRPYPCAPDRKPACNAAGTRCVCLERTECGGTRDEPY